LEDTLTFPRIFTRFAYWRECPPTHVLVRAIAVGLGVFKPETKPTAFDNARVDAELRAAFPSGVIT
jgi:hypothetical protein